MSTSKMSRFPARSWRVLVGMLCNLLIYKVVLAPYKA